jgi:cytoskeleton protein RodZ
MSDAPARAASAGALLKAARERQGLHIAALAAAIKVHQRKLEALEADRWSELPDATFARALAQTVCRTLKIDARPVLELLPPGGALDLQPTPGTLNTPFRERPGRDDPGLSRLTIRPMVLAGVALVAAAAVLYFLPAGTLSSKTLLRSAPGAASAAAASAAAGTSTAPIDLAASSAAGLAPDAMQPGAAAGSAPDAGTGPVFPPSGPDANSAVMPVLPAAAATLASTGATGATFASASAAAGSPTGNLQVRTTEASWVEIRDTKGQVVASRTVLPGEPLALDAEPPFRLTIGNAAVTQLTFRGKPVDLKPSTRDNVARVEMK